MHSIKIFFAGFLFLLLNQSSLLTRENNGVDSNAAVQKLIEGNKRSISEKVSHPNFSAERRNELSKKQHPFAVILSCSDSRVPPEIIFDQGLGDLFVIRNAGNIVNNEVLGSIEYAVEHLGVHLVVVLGHERCGAVSAALEGGDHHGHIKYLINAIKPAVEKVKRQSGDALENAVKANISFVVGQLNASKPILEDFVKQGKLKIIGAYYDLDNGSVTFNK